MMYLQALQMELVCVFIAFQKGVELEEKDILEKKLLMFNDVFADLVDGVGLCFCCIFERRSVGGEGYFIEETFDVQ